MLRWRFRILKTMYMFLEFFALTLSIPLAFSFAYHLFGQYNYLQSSMETYVFISVTYICHVSFFMLVELYDSYLRSNKPITSLLAVKTALAFIPGHITSYVVFLNFFQGYSYYFHALHTALFLAISILGKMAFFIIRSMDKQDKRNVLLIGQSRNGKNYLEAIQNYSCLHYNIIGFIHIKNMPRGYPPNHLTGNGEHSKHNNQGDSIYGNLPHLGGLEDLVRIVSTHVVDELVVTRPLSYDKRLENILRDIQKRGITITMLLNRLNINTAHAIVTMIDDIPALKFHTVSLDENQLMAKRILDFLGALAGMVIFCMAWLVFAPLIKLESKGPVIFKQARVGKNGRVFMMWKFRSMIDGADAMKKNLAAKNEMQGHMFKMADDPRVTQIGRIMRKTNIDELPQFYNVLIGDMSLVGTRPPTVDEVKEYQAHHYKRISIIPGITGLWQTSSGKKITNFEEIVQLDNEYIQDWSVWKDIKIISKTLVLIVFLVHKAFKDAFSKLKEKMAPYNYPEHETIQKPGNGFNALKILTILRVMMFKSFRQ